MFFNWPRKKAAFSYPVPPAPPTAVLVPWFRPSGRVRVFPGGWGSDAAAFGPAAIAGSWTQLEDLLTERIPTLTHAVIVLARGPGELLTEERRDRLWQSVRVPIFEQIVSENGALLAAECEAHDGCHIESDTLTWEPSSLDPYSIVYGPCGCGRVTPRLKTTVHRLRTVAAYAR